MVQGDEESETLRRTKTRTSHVENFVAGAFAGLFAETWLHPFDTINTRMKVVRTEAKRGVLATCRQVVRTEGVAALYAGVGATVIASFPSTAIYFGVYEFVKDVGEEAFPAYTPVVHLVAGAASELAGSLITVPCEVVKCRLQLGTVPSLTRLREPRAHSEPPPTLVPLRPRRPPQGPIPPPRAGAGSPGKAAAAQRRGQWHRAAGTTVARSARSARSPAPTACAVCTRGTGRAC